jgi:hypothetical protein
LGHLRYFVAVVEEGSLTTGAERTLHTSQPSLSRRRFSNCSCRASTNWRRRTRSTGAADVGLEWGRHSTLDLRLTGALSGTIGVLTIVGSRCERDCVQPRLNCAEWEDGFLSEVYGPPLPLTGPARHFRCGPAVANFGVASYICSLDIGLDFSIRQPERKVPDISLGRFEGGRRALDRVTG